MRIFEAHYFNGYGHRHEITPEAGGKAAYYRITKDGQLDLLSTATITNDPSDSGTLNIDNAEALVVALESAPAWEEL